MKKLFTMLIIIFILYLGIQVAFNFFSKGHNNEYEIKVQNTVFTVKEEASFKDNNYYFEINGGTNTFKFQIYNNFNRLQKVIESLEYFKDERYECILPIFKDNTIITDIMCMNNGVIYYYRNIKSNDKQLDDFVSTINNYDINKYIDNTTAYNIEKIDVYKNNLIKDHYIGITNYKGIYNISSNFNSIVYNISLFKEDIYNQKLGTFIDRYYVVADYDKEYEFNEFRVVDLVSLDTDKIKSDESITHDGYIQGVVDNKIYLFDKDREYQFEINIDNETVIKNSKNNIRYYNSGNFTTMSLKDAKEELKFVYDEINYQNNEYSRIDRVGNETGYYYLYKNNGHGYDAYRINIQDNEGITYLFSTNTIDNIFYINNYIYFINNSTVQVYHDDFGVKNIVKYNELAFNKNIIFNVYSK
ncbi:MAG: hypothetical protein J6B98_01295 [Bacilli bacterium]|nr:hypothetical protein [Bacilli bacterium]